MADITHIAARITGDDGVVRLYVASVVSTHPTAATLPADAAGDVSATVGALEALLAECNAAAIPAGTFGHEGQLIT